MRPDGFATITHYIFAADADALISFLCAAFAGKEVGRSTRPDGKVANGQVRIGEVTVMVSDASENYSPSRASM